MKSFSDRHPTSMLQLRNDSDQPADCGDLTGQKCGQTTDGRWIAYHLINSPGDFGPSELNKSCRRTASSPAGYILYCNIFIIKPYNIGHTDLDVFVCKSFCHIDIIIQV